MKDLILEIGCENLPPAGIRPAFEQLRVDSARRLDELRLSYDRLYTTGSSRRLVLIVEGLASAQAAQKETITGPPMSKSFDDRGRPTKAATGFAKAHGVPLSQVGPVGTGRGEYLGFIRSLKSQRTPALLRTLVPELITGLRFPKMMRWEPDNVRFARPIRWIVCLYGDKVIRFTLAGVKSGDRSYATPWLEKRSIRIRSARAYIDTLSAAGVIVDVDQRRRTVEKLALTAAGRAGLELVADRELVTELTFMLEEPHAFVGDFDKQYLELPPEVVITAMKAHQRYFALRDRRKKLVAKFLAFAEGKPGSPTEVRRGNEKVLRARLEDAHFYWQEDLKRGIEGLAGMLGAIVFIEGLGTLADKAERVGELATVVNDRRDPKDRLPRDVIRRGARLAKADLASEMVKDGKEFTKLEGLIGSHYARAAGEDAAVAAAVSEHYLPRAPGDPLPRSPLGRALGIADRMDTIAGCFIAGMIPTGSQDPYALRRSANGLIRILERHPEIGIDTLIDASLATDERWAVRDVMGDVGRQLVDFFRLRCETFLKERGIPYDVVGAVSAVAWPRPHEAVRRAEAVQALRGDPAFERLITGVKRVGNIIARPLKVYGAPWETLRGALTGSGALTGGVRFSPERFEDDAERRLHDQAVSAVPRLAEYEQRSDFGPVLEILSGLGPAIDTYFDKVLVNCDDEAVRSNRHHFLATLYAVFSRYADFSHIVEDTPAEQT